MPMCVRRRGRTRWYLSKAQFGWRHSAAKSACVGDRANEGDNAGKPSPGCVGCESPSPQGDPRIGPMRLTAPEPVSSPARTRTFWTELARGLLALALIAAASFLLAMGVG